MKWITLISILLLATACADDEQLAKEALTANFNVKDQVRYKSVTHHPGRVVCGTYEVLDQWGKSSGTKRFVYRPDSLSSRANTEEWSIFCSEDPAAALYEKTGINAAAINSSHLRQLRADFASLGEEFKVTKPEDVELIEDPWGNLYGYIEPWFAGVQADIKVVSYGADGVEGGADENADIGDWQMPYIDHIRGL